MLNRVLLNQVATGQQQRNISSGSIKGYLSKMHVLTNKINQIEDLRFEALEFDVHGTPLRHSNAAHDVLTLKLPMAVETARLLFAALSIDGALPRKRRAQARQIDVIELDEGFEPAPPQIPVAPQVVNQFHIGENISTVSAQSYQNYKSALKWWHEYSNAEYDKIGCDFPTDVDKAINSQIASSFRIQVAQL